MNILNIKFRKTKKVYPFIVQEDEDYSKGDYVIVETIRGDQIGMVISKNKFIPKNEEVEDIKIREVKRKLNKKEIETLPALDKKADEAYFKCKKK